MVLYAHSYLIQSEDSDQTTDVQGDQSLRCMPMLYCGFRCAEEIMSKKGIAKLIFLTKVCG